MKVAAPYTSDSRWENIPDEYNITYTDNSSLQKIINFCSKYSNKRINIDFDTEEIDEELLKTIFNLFNNVYIRVKSSQLNKIAFLKENNMKFFFDVDLPCYSLSLLDFMLELGCTDIYIYDNLCYYIPDIAERCHLQNVNLRLILNRIPSVNPEAGQKYLEPVFSPRDMEVLNKYIDVGEFDCWETKGAYNWNKFNVYYKIWFIKQDWQGQLRDINLDVHFDYPVQSIPKNFIDRKISCGRRCSLGLNCSHCKTYMEIGQELNEENLYFPKEGK